MSDQTMADVVIVGGGISGLWLLNRLRKLGYNALLIEKAGLGARQTGASQGIIHGGTKYALTGELTESAKAVAAMPGLWRDCLNGVGELDLSSVKLLSEHQYIWSTSSLGSRLTGFFASKLMRSRTQVLSASDYPVSFQNPHFKGNVYRLNEPVLELNSLLTALKTPFQEFLLKAEALKIDSDGDLWKLSDALDSGRLPIFARHIIFAAGEGNEALLQQLGLNGPKMQRRPLQMVMVRGSEIVHPLYAHCMGTGTVPRMTVTSHKDSHNSWVWYLGGALAEEGAAMTAEKLILKARKEMDTLFPWIKQDELQWSCVKINRAEVETSGGVRPDYGYSQSDRRLSVIWPTKLALAPVVSAQIISKIEGQMSPNESSVDLDGWPLANNAPLPWRDETLWN